MEDNLSPFIVRYKRAMNVLRSTWSTMNRRREALEKAEIAYRRAKVESEDAWYACMHDDLARETPEEVPSMATEAQWEDFRYVVKDQFHYFLEDCAIEVGIEWQDGLYEEALLALGLQKIPSSEAKDLQKIPSSEAKEKP